MTAYYNENNPEAAAWLRELIKAGLIAPGHVDDRSIEDVQLADLDGFTQFHFFAGIGVWSYALRCAGRPDGQGDGSAARGLADSRCEQRERGENPCGPAGEDQILRGEGLSDDQRGGLDGNPRPTHGLWRDADWLLCRDGKWRPVEPGVEPLAHGAPARVGRLRGYGNAIVAPQAEAFVRAYMETIGLPTRRDPLPLLAMGGSL